MLSKITEAGSGEWAAGRMNVAMICAFSGYES